MGRYNAAYFGCSKRSNGDCKVSCRKRRRRKRERKRRRNASPCCCAERQSCARETAVGSQSKDQRRRRAGSHRDRPGNRMASLGYGGVSAQPRRKIAETLASAALQAVGRSCPRFTATVLPE